MSSYLWNWSSSISADAVNHKRHFVSLATGHTFLSTSSALSLWLDFFCHVFGRFDAFFRGVLFAEIAEQRKPTNIIIVIAAVFSV